MGLNDRGVMILDDCEQILNTADVMQKLSFNVTFDVHGKEKNRKIFQTVKNHEVVLNYDLRFAGKIKFDEFSQQTFLSGTVPWDQKNNYRAWGSFDDSSAFSIIQADYGLCKRQDFFDAVRNVSMRNRFHPVRKILGDCCLTIWAQKIANTIIRLCAWVWLERLLAHIRPGLKTTTFRFLLAHKSVGKVRF